jgi:hypothetical protein
MSRNEQRSGAEYRYDQALDMIADGDKAAAEHDDHTAADHYQEAVRVSDVLIREVERDQDLTATYSTKTDGRIDRPTLLARAREHRAHAAQLAERADARHTEALIAEFHPTPDQRKVLLDLGRPEVTQQQGHTCWVYLRRGVRETFCWTRSGEVADHTRVDEAAIAKDRIATTASRRSRAATAVETARPAAGRPTSRTAPRCTVTVSRMIAHVAAGRPASPRAPRTACVAAPAASRAAGPPSSQTARARLRPATSATA